MKVSYFPGCTLRNKARDLDRYARASAEALGIECILLNAEALAQQPEAAGASEASAATEPDDAASSFLPNVCCSQPVKLPPRQALPAALQPDRASEAAASPEARRTVRRVIFFMQKTS